MVKKDFVMMKKPVRRQSEQQQQINPKFERQRNRKDVDRQANIGRNLFSQALKESSTESEYDQEHAKIKGTNTQYEDRDFPANKYSISQGPSGWPKTLGWFRPDEFWNGEKYHLFTDGIEPQDIKQGIIGDCYFLCALASIAEKDERIMKLFLNAPHTNHNGIYGVNICDGGEWKVVVIDDLFPCYNQQRGPCFSRGHGKEIWVLVIEKAWAKTYGNYKVIEAGFTREALSAFTGAPARTFQMDEEGAWEQLMKAETVDWVMTAGTNTMLGVSNEPLSNGLVAGHAYSLLSVHEVDYRGNVQQLVKLRNPWGSGEWNGDWSDDSQLWTNKLKQQLNVQNLDDGIFYMSFDDFKKNLQDFQICYVQDGFEHSFYKSRSSYKEMMYYKMTVPKAGLYYVAIHQTSSRKFKKSQNYQYSEVRLVIAKDSGNNSYKYITSYTRALDQVWVKCKYLTVGNYVVHVSVDWYQKNTRQFVLSAYGCGKASFAPLPKLSNFLKSTFCDRGRQVDESKKKSLANKGAPNSYKVFSFDDAYSYYYINNLRGENTINAMLRFTKMEGVEYLDFQGKESNMSVPERGENIILMIKEGSYSIGYGEMISVKRSTEDLIPIAVQQGSQKTVRKGKQVIVKQYSYQHDDGIFYYFQNVSNNKTFEQNITYTLTGLKIVPGGGNTVAIKIGPGESQSIDLRKTGNQMGLSMKMSTRIY